MMKKILAIASLMTLPFAAPAVAAPHDMCMIIGNIAYTTMELRQDGADQGRAANFLEVTIGDEISKNPHLNRDQKHAFAYVIGRMSTFMLTTAYSIPVYNTYQERELAPNLFAEMMYEDCRTM